MKLFIKLRNKYFTALATLVLLVLASIGLFNLCTPQMVEASMIKFDNESAVTITNGSFTSFSSSASYPYTLSNFTTSGNKTPEMKTGAINISDKDYAKYYKNYGLSEYENPKGVGSDNYVLMINADKTSNYTYTSKEFTLSKNGCYYVTVSAKTIGDSSIASVFLTQDGLIFEDCLIESISSTTWSNYTFFVTTNSYTDVKLKFNMQIGNQSTGASGCVLFDELHAGQISEETRDDAITTLDNNSYKVVDFSIPNAYKEYKFDNQIVEYTRNDKGEIVYDIDGNPVLATSNENYFSDVTSGAGEKSFEISNNTISLNVKDTYIKYKGQEEILDPNSIYRFSIWANASEISSGSAFVQLDEIIDESEEYDDFMDSENVDMTPKSSSLMITSVTDNNVTNGYVEYVIYVRTGALNTSKVQFSFGVGDEDENSTAKVSFKQYLIERVPYSAYGAVSTSATVGTIDISSRLTLNSDEYSNYTFDQMQSDSFDGIPYPANPSSWTKSSDGKGELLSGVVNLSAFDKVMKKYSYINTMSTPSVLNNNLNNNVLMIYNGTNATHSYTSASKTLEAKHYYKITVFVNTYISGNSDNGVTIVAKADNHILGMATDINTHGAWQRVVLYVNTPANSVDLSLELALGYGKDLSSGYAFFDNILIEKSETEGDFSNRFNQYEISENGQLTLDLNNPMLTTTTGKEYGTSALYSGANKGNTTINAGVVDLNSDLTMIASTKREALRDLKSTNKSVLAIVTALQKDGYYKYTSIVDYSFESGKYYKISFDLFTDGIGQEEKENKDSMYDNGVLAQGVNIELTNLENAKFSYITSDGKWTHYDVYVGIDSEIISNLEFSLGSEATGCYGRAFLGNIELAEVEEAEFTESSNSATVLKVDTIKTPEEEETPEITSNNGNGFSWVYIPTIATFLAIIVAVVGVFVRRNIKFKKHVKVGRAEYDRDVTVMQNKYRRLAQDQRAKDVRELTKECDELIVLRTEYENKYKEALSRLRSARLANRDGSKRHEIMAIEHEVKHISKEVARFGVQVNNYENEIEFMQTEAYLIDLEKRMMREDEHTRGQLRKEAEMSDVDRAEAIAKRKAKQEKAELKAKDKAEKLAQKQQKLEMQRKQVQDQLTQAKALDEKYVKEQELKQIKLEEIKLAKEQAKAQKELEKLEKQRAKEIEITKLETSEVEEVSSEDDNALNTENVEQTESENVENQQTDKEVSLAQETESKVDEISNINDEENNSTINENKQEEKDIPSDN